VITPAPEGAVLEIWQPKPTKLRPRGLTFLPYVVWWLFHYCGVFGSADYRVFLLREDGRIIHRSCLFPSFFRFPFMSRDDLQVGDVWTAAERRRHGVSTWMLKQILALQPQKVVWFLCDASNSASAALARSAGMELHGVGRREPRFGVAILGRFVIRSFESK
jgi:hypothetical protein